MNSRCCEAALLAALSLGLVVATSANAAVADGDAATPTSQGAGLEELTEIVVTARRIEERAQDVPISMTIFSQQQLADHNIQTSGDLAAYTPSLSTGDFFGQQEVTSFSIRGFVQALGTTPSVAVYFADAVVPRGGNIGENAGSGVPPGSFFDLQNVEVLKGPQGTLFGRNTDGGAVLLVPKKPTSEFEGYVEGGYGNYAMGEVQGVVNIPVNDNLRVRVGVNHETRTGYMQNITGIGPTNFGDVGFTAARLSVVWDVAPNLENYTVATYNLSNTNGALWQMFACNPDSRVAPIGAIFCPATLEAQQSAGPYAVQNDLSGAKSYLRQLQYINTTAWQASDHLTVKNIVNYGQLRTELDTALWGANFTGTGILGFPQGAPIYSVITSPRDAGFLTTDQYTWSDELQLQGDALSNRLIWQSGAYIERSGPSGNQVTGSRSGNVVTCTNLAALDCQGIGQSLDEIATSHNSDVAGYAQASYNILDQLKFTGGLRYTSDESSATANQLRRVFPAPNTPFTLCVSQLTTVASNCFQSFQQDSHALTYLAGLDYMPVQDVMLYAKYSRGYRQGGVATVVSDGFHTYKPEHVDTYEIGEKTSFHRWVDGVFNVSAFYNNFTDQQLFAVFLPGPTASVGLPPLQGIINAGTSHLWGTEIESAITPVKPITLGVSYAYINTKLVSTVPQPLPAQGYLPVSYSSAIGGVLPFTPTHKVAANLTYRLPVPDSLGKVSYNATWTYQSNQLVTIASPFGVIHPYGLLDMNLNWSSLWGSPVDLELFASNVTNRLYYTGGDTPYATQYGFAVRLLGEPRMYGARVRVKFGK